MDKKPLLIKPLAMIMENHKDQIIDLVHKHDRPVIEYKSDGSPVTALDLALSDLIEEVSLQHLATDFTFYSEEKFDAWSFPLLALDPLDGTREYIGGRPEWALSLGFFPENKFQGEGWIFNPKTLETFNNDSLKPHKAKFRYHGEVSRSEWERGLFHQIESEKFKLIPMGSIAYKLGRLSAGKTDFVVSLQPKNIWDIAGGTLLCQEAGYKFYSKGKEVTHVQKIYSPPLIWCHESLFSELLKLFA